MEVVGVKRKAGACGEVRSGNGVKEIETSATKLHLRVGEQHM